MFPRVRDDLAVAHLRLKLRALLDLLRYFSNPWLVIAMRLGLVRMPFFSYRIRKGMLDVTMLARPASASMGDLFVLREVFVDETYGAILSLLENKPAAVVDIGANLGSFTIWLHRRHGVARAFCFEPEPGSFRLCQFNLFQNDCSMATPVPCAIGGTARRIRITGNRERPGAVNIYGNNVETASSTEVQVLALADWLRGVEGNFDVLKLDCEGAEWELVAHTPAECWRRFRVIVAEIHTDPDGKYRHDDFESAMRRHGFKTLRWDGGHMGLYLGVRDSA